MKLFFAVLLALIYGSSLLSDYLAPHGYEEQLRESSDSPPSRAFLLGTDELGRDRFSRLLHGARVSLTLAPAAALLSVAIAALLGGFAGSNRSANRAISGIAQVTMSLPWLFLLLGVRAALPLNTTPWASVTITFALLGVLGWAGPAQVVRNGVEELWAADFVLAARARGIGRSRILICHLLPNVWPVLTAEFWTSLPMLILAEANLGMLGLGVSEPLPSLGNLLRGLETQASGWDHPLSRFWLFAPILLLSCVLLCFQFVVPSGFGRTEFRQ